jgi:hypothetical protein
VVAEVVVVHGIGQQLLGPELLLDQWGPAVRDGIRLAGGSAEGLDVTCAFYGDLFRRTGTRQLGDPELDATDVESDLERELLLAWWEEAAYVDPAVIGPRADTRLRTPHVIQRALDALSRSVFFAGLAERALVFDLKQVRRYLTDRELRERIRSRVAACVTSDTSVVIGHSLGSVVAYETLCRHPEWNARTLVTLGSPLGIRHLIFERLDPAPEDGLGVWPGPVERWVNVVDRGDIVALIKRLAPLFGEDVEDMVVHNGAKAHDIRPYLTAVETGRAIADGLTR